MADAMLRKAGISSDKRAGFLAEAEIDRLEEFIKDPAKSGLPSWLFNRRKEPGDWKRHSLDRRRVWFLGRRWT